MTSPLAGRHGSGSAAFRRQQSVRIADCRIEGGCTGGYELIFPSCGDDPYLDSSEIPPRFQRLRRPRLLEAALAACHRHLGFLWAPRTEPEASRYGWAVLALPFPKRTILPGGVVMIGPGEHIKSITVGKVYLR